MSWKVTVSKTTSDEPTTSETRTRRSSGMGTTATLGSIVVNA